MASPIRHIHLALLILLLSSAHFGLGTNAATRLPDTASAGQKAQLLATTSSDQYVFGPYKYTASEGPIDVEFYAGDFNLLNATLIVERVDGENGSAAVAVNGAPLVEVSDFTPGLERVSRDLDLYSHNSISISVSEGFGKGVRVAIAASPISVTEFHLTPDWIATGVATEVIVSARVTSYVGNDLGDPQPVLERTTAEGALVSIEGSMVDDGSPASGDETPADGVFSFKGTYNSATDGLLYFRVRTVVATTECVSHSITLESLVPFSSSQFLYKDNLQSEALVMYRSLRPSLGEVAAAQATLQFVSSDAQVEDAQLVDGGSMLTIEMDNGLIGGVMLENPTLGDTSPKHAPQTIRARPSNTAVPRSTERKDAATAAEHPSSRAAQKAGSPPRPIGNNKVIILDPFLFNLPGGAPAWDGIEQLFKGACGDFDVKPFLFTDATIDAYKTMSDFGVIVLVGHSYSNATISGEEATYDRRLHYMRDINAKRVGDVEYTPRVQYGDPFEDTLNLFYFTSSFVTGYATRDGYPNSVVAAATCFSANGTMRPAYIASGVNSIIAQQDYGHSEFMTANAYNVLSNWLYLPGVDIEAAYAAALPNGNCDVQDPINHPHWHFGCVELILHPSKAGALLPQDEFRNGSFETGDFSAWSAVGTFGPQPTVVRNVAQFSPTKGSFAARLNLPPIYRHFGNSIRQTVCLRGRRLESISFDYNFLIPNLPQVCGQALPFIEVHPITNRTPPLQGDQYVDPYGCEAAIPTSLSCSEFVNSQGQPTGCTGVWSLGWRSTTINLSNDPYQSGAEWVTISINLDADRGGVLYDFGVSALIDNIKIKLVPDSPTRPDEAGRGEGADAYSDGGLVFPDAGSAVPYSSLIDVTGVGGGGGGDRGEGEVAIEHMRVGVQGLSHTFPDDVDLLLQGPNGLTVLLMSDAGGGRDLSGVQLVFDDTASSMLPDDQLVEDGVYRPTNHLELFDDDFPLPAPGPPYGEALAAFTGSNPNGLWRLFAVDNASGDSGEVMGWSLHFDLVNRAPLALCSDVIVEAFGDCVADASIDAGSSDPDGDEILAEQSPAGPYPIGVTSVTLTITDPDGLTSQCVATVTVVDGESPSVVCPAGTSVELTSGCLIPIPNVLLSSTASDNCSASGALVLAQSPTAGTMVGLGNHTIAVSATDAAGNVGTCATSLTVVDARPPTITGPVPAIYLRTSSSAGGATVTFPTPSASDNCGTVNVTATPASGSTFPNGKTLVTATAVDAAGLTASTQFTVKVVRFGESIGIYIPSTAGWFLKNTNSEGGADLVFSFGPVGDGWVPIAGDWDRSGTDTPGLFYNPTAGVFLSDTSGPGGANYVFTYGPSGLNWIPLAGDWNGEGVDSIGLYDPTTGNFFLKNINAAGNADVILQLGPGNAGFLPIVGDWNGDGIDTVGIYNPDTGAFFLRNSNTNGPADLTFTFGAEGKGYLPISGDWNGDNVCTIGLYDPTTGAFLLRNSNDNGPADMDFLYGPGGEGAIPVAGSWDGQ